MTVPPHHANAPGAYAPPALRLTVVPPAIPLGATQAGNPESLWQDELQHLLARCQVDENTRISMASEPSTRIINYWFADDGHNYVWWKAGESHVSWQRPDDSVVHIPYLVFINMTHEDFEHYDDDMEDDECIDDMEGRCEFCGLEQDSSCGAPCCPESLE